MKKEKKTTKEEGEDLLFRHIAKKFSKKEIDYAFRELRKLDKILKSLNLLKR